MLCTTTKNGSECSFMSKKGCSYAAGTCLPIVDNCNGCARIMVLEQGSYCSACPDPAAKWKRGACNLATHVAAEKLAGGAKLNPLKASKRASKGK
jgi:hypothetical protein